MRNAVGHMSRFGFIPVVALVWLFCAGSVVLAQSPDFLRRTERVEIPLAFAKPLA